MFFFSGKATTFLMPFLHFILKYTFKWMKHAVISIDASKITTSNTTLPISCSSLCTGIRWSFMKIYISLAVLNAIAAVELEACTSEKIFARAVADECVPLDDHSTTLDWTAVTGEIFEARFFKKKPWKVSDRYGIIGICDGHVTGYQHILSMFVLCLINYWFQHCNRHFFSEN